MTRILCAGLTALYPPQQAFSILHSKQQRTAAPALPWSLISLHEISKARTDIFWSPIQIPKGRMCVAVCVKDPSLLWWSERHSEHTTMTFRDLLLWKEGSTVNWALQHGRASQLPENVHILSFIQVIQQPLKLKCEDSYKRKVRLRVFQGSQDCSAVRAGERKPRPVFPTNPHDQNGIVKGKRTIFFPRSRS